MSHKSKSFSSHVEEMQNMALMLMPYSYPQVERIEELEIDCLKQRTLCIDGYYVVVYLSRANHDICQIETLEIIGLYTPFLPMYLICKLGAIFLGGHELKYSESFKLGRKVYIWSIGVDNHGHPLELTSSELEKCSYENFDYSYSATEVL